MKRTYIKPAVEVLDLETKATCVLPVSYSVKDNGSISNPDTDHGYIIEDKGDGNNGDYDPWDPDKW